MIKIQAEVKTDFDVGSKGNEIIKRARLFLLDFMLNVEKEAKLKAPVDTGRLRASIFTFPTTPSNKISVADQVKYGVFQEFGTYKMKAQPFMRPALNKVRLTKTKELMKKYKLA